MGWNRRCPSLHWNAQQRVCSRWDENTHNDSTFDPHFNVIVQPNDDFCSLRGESVSIKMT